jgi:hypothetical protein
MVSNALTHKAFLSFYKLEKHTILNFFLNANYLHAFFPDSPFTGNALYFPIAYSYDCQLFGAQLTPEFDTGDFLDLFFVNVLLMTVEIYKILALLYTHAKSPNVNYLCLCGISNYLKLLLLHPRRARFLNLSRDGVYCLKINICR